MSDDDKSMDIQLICNQHVVTYNEFWDINPMGLSSSWYDSYDIIALNAVKQFKGWTQWALVPLGPTLLRWFTCCQKEKLWEMNPIVLCAPWANFIDIIAFHPKKNAMN